MKLPKSERVQGCLSVIGITLAVLLFYGLPPVLARAINSQPIQKVESKEKSYSEPGVVNLLAGKKFISYGPVIGGVGTYVVDERPANEKPRRLPVIGPGRTTEKIWEVYFYIQEH